MDVKQTRLGFVLFAMTAAVVAAFLLGRAQHGPPPGGDHRSMRQLILYYTLSRVDDPIIVLGDSIVEASTLPGSACGHAIVNAGLGGASTASDLGSWLGAALAGKRAFAIIVSLGTNDALMPTPAQAQLFAERYETLLRELSKQAARLFIVEIPPVEARERLSVEMRAQAMTTIGAFRAVLPQLATRTGATLLPMPEMSAPFTIDGVHLNDAGYRAWNEAVMQGTALACG
jgi:lysophospholipase L1-like esterase